MRPRTAPRVTHDRPPVRHGGALARRLVPMAPRGSPPQTCGRWGTPTDTTAAGGRKRRSPEGPCAAALAAPRAGPPTHPHARRGTRLREQGHRRRAHTVSPNRPLSPPNATTLGQWGCRYVMSPVGNAGDGPQGGPWAEFCKRGGGGLGGGGSVEPKSPKVCVPKIAQINIAFSKFSKFFKFFKFLNFTFSR